MALKRKQTKFNVFELRTIQQEIVATEERRQQVQSELLAARVRQLALLQEAAQLKAGPQLAAELETIMLRLKLNNEKSR